MIYVTAVLMEIFALLGVVCVGVIDPTCVFVWTTTPHSQLVAELGKIQPSVVFFFFFFFFFRCS